MCHVPAIADDAQETQQALGKALTQLSNLEGVPESAVTAALGGVGELRAEDSAAAGGTGVGAVLRGDQADMAKDFPTAVSSAAAR